jgi:hypothetical protein
MPRGSAARRRREAEPKAPTVYEVSPEIETVMARVVRLFPDHFGWSLNFKLGGVIVRGSTPKDEGGCNILARFVKVPPLWHGLTGYDAIVRVEEWAWGRLGPSEQEALIAHELSHGAMSDKGALRVEKHDLEEFSFVVRHYGAWQEGIALFDRQLELFEPGLGRQEPAQAVVLPFERPKSTTCPYPECTLATAHAGPHFLAHSPAPAADSTRKRQRRGAGTVADGSEGMQRGPTP